MNASPRVSRVIVVVLDGLRSDAIPLFGLDRIATLAVGGAHTFAARTVVPSVTAAAMTSLFAGVGPRLHGMQGERFRMPRPSIALDPLTQVLASSGFETSAHLARIPLAYRGLASRLARMLGVRRARFSGRTSSEILDAARDTLISQRRGLIFLHWPDADRAGHEHGWTTRPYATAARRLDSSLGRLDDMTGASRDPETLLIAFADHGGGGRCSHHHDSTHPRDLTIPIVLAGGRVAVGELAPQTSLLDIPPTILWALGITPPASYSGRTLLEAFASDCDVPDEGGQRYATVAAC